jgi:hypothetical protein
VREPHKTVPIQVWVDVDEPMAATVKALQEIPGVRTHASCQGTIGEGGPEPYKAYVTVSWADDEALAFIRRTYKVKVRGTNYGDVCEDGE